jgi:hypothetical protein
MMRLKVKAKEQLPQGQVVARAHLAMTGRGKAAGVKLYVNGQARETEAERDQLKESFANAEPLRVGARNAETQFTGLVDDVRFYGRGLVRPRMRACSRCSSFLPLIAKSRGHRTEEERGDLARIYKAADAVDYLRAEAALASAEQKKEALYGEIPTLVGHGRNGSAPGRPTCRCAVISGSKGEQARRPRRPPCVSAAPVRWPHQPALHSPAGWWRRGRFRSWRASRSTAGGACSSAPVW